MKSLWIAETIKYDGRQLRSLYNYLEKGVLGDSVVAFRGPCDVVFEHMVDGEDLASRSAIRGDDMLHFLVERFETALITGVFMQRLLSSLAFEELIARLPSAAGWMRRGDDIYFQQRKLSISVATVSPVSALIHFAMNVQVKNVPVAAIGLDELAIEPEPFAHRLMAKFCEEIITSEQAVRKVRWVT